MAEHGFAPALRCHQENTTSPNPCGCQLLPASVSVPGTFCLFQNFLCIEHTYFSQFSIWKVKNVTIFQFNRGILAGSETIFTFILKFSFLFLFFPHPTSSPRHSGYHSNGRRHRGCGLLTINSWGPHGGGGWRSCCWRRAPLLSCLLYRELVNEPAGRFGAEFCSWSDACWAVLCLRTRDHVSSFLSGWNC